MAPLPNSICAKCAGADDFSADYNRCVGVFAAGRAPCGLSHLTDSSHFLLSIGPHPRPRTNHSSFLDFGNWLTSTMVVSGFALPVTLAHAGVIHSMACIMAMVGGGLVYGTSEYRWTKESEHTCDDAQGSDVLTLTLHTHRLDYAPTNQF